MYTGSVLGLAGSVYVYRVRPRSVRLGVCIQGPSLVWPARCMYTGSVLGLAGSVYVYRVGPMSGRLGVCLYRVGPRSGRLGVCIQGPS